MSLLPAARLRHARCAAHSLPSPGLAGRRTERCREHRRPWSARQRRRDLHLVLSAGLLKKPFQRYPIVRPGFDSAKMVNSFPNIQARQLKLEGCLVGTYKALQQDHENSNGESSYPSSARLGFSSSSSRKTDRICLFP
ncbi:hypothetical protein MPLSOD_100325 [Mesorhizobium sp. SOD10]|nr:hypothetical protein MPLSOD_100325 [Mesorhizobium sp. SOD10]